MPTRLRSPVARAVVPVLGGIGILALIALFTWAMAAFISSGDNAESSERLAPRTIALGGVENRAADVAADGPLLFPGLNTTVGERSLVLDHDGGNPATGWVVYAAHPADRPMTCAIDQVVGTDRFVDCEGRELHVSELAPPGEGIRPIVYDRERLELDLSGVTAPTTTG
ncbi:MAG: hypothetical protein WD225_06920 [Ilumatobacteraceae bacterium]